MRLLPVTCLGVVLLLPGLTPAVPPSNTQAASAVAVAAERVEDLRADQPYGAGVRVRAPFRGISFVIPPEWRGSLPPGSQAMILESGTRPGIGLVVFLEEVAPEDVAAHLGEPQALDEGFILHPTGPVTINGSRLSGAYAVGTSIGRAIAIVGPARNAVVFLLTGPKQEAAYYERLLDQLDTSTRFTTAETMVALKGWYGRLSGMMLTRQAAPDRVSEIWHLCGDGRFYYVRSAAGVEQERVTGSWRVDLEGEQARLALTAEDAASTAHALRIEGVAVFLDSLSILMAPSDQCP